MSTRAVYTFIDTNKKYHVYKHHDGYPSGALEFIARAQVHAWPLPRFEADEFACAFISANKSEAGGMYLTDTYESHGDLAYRYEIRRFNKTLLIHVYSINSVKGDSKLVSSGTLEELCLHFKVNLKDVIKFKLEHDKAKELERQEIETFYSKAKLKAVNN